MKRKLLVPAAILLFAVLGSACGTASSAINELCLVYSGGITEDAHFEKLLPPGSNNNSVGMGSSTYCYRIDQRSYIANAKNNGADAPPVEVVSNDDVRLAVDYELYFTLNQDEAVLRQFHEDLGVKTEAWKQDGWVQLLREYFEPQIDRALETAALQFNWRDLYGSEESRQEFERATVAQFRRNINEVIGGDYFCGPNYKGPGTECGDVTFAVGRPSPVNGDIIAAIEAEQTNAARTVAQEQENARIRAELDVERELVALYGSDGALLREAIRNGQVQIMVVPEGQSVTTPTPTPSG